MYLEGDALDLFAWINSERTLLYWEELVKALQENYGPAEFQNPDEHLCSIRQLRTVQEYRQEFAKRSARVKNWPEHCLLGVFLNGLKEELKAHVRIHKPRSVHKAMSLALEFKHKAHFNWHKASQWPNSSKFNPAPNFSLEVFSNQIGNQLASQATTSTPPSTRQLLTRAWDIEKQNRISKGLCFSCNEKFAPGHRYKTVSLTLLELANGDEPAEDAPVDNNDMEPVAADLAEISFHAIQGKNSGSTMKLQGLSEDAQC